MLQVALAPCAPFTVTKRLMVDSVGLAERFGCRLHTHLGETRDENEYCLEHFGCRPVDYLEECGWLSDRVWLAHGIHFNDDEVRRLGRHHVGVCHCPTSNMVLASGQCRTKELEAAGSPVGLGVDGSASNDNSNLIEGVRHALMINRLTYDAASVTHFDAFRWATEGSARCARARRHRHDRGRQAGRPRLLHASTSCASPAPATRSRRWCSAARTPPTGSWSRASGGSSTACRSASTWRGFATSTAPRRRRFWRRFEEIVFTICLTGGPPIGMPSTSEKRSHEEGRSQREFGPQGDEGAWGDMILPRRHWAEMTTRDFADSDTASWIAVLPVAAIEQHGPHLPVYTDTCIAEGMIRRVDRTPAGGTAGDLPAGAGGRQIERAHLVAGDADQHLGDDDEALARHRRQRRIAPASRS